MREKLLIVDDEETARYGIRRALSAHGFLFLESGDLASARKVIRTDAPDLVLLDLNLPDGNGLALLQELSLAAGAPRVIVITARGTERIAADAIKAGAYDYLAKPFEIEDLRLRVRNALEDVRLRKENASLRQELGQTYGALVGDSAAMKKVFDLIQRVAPSDVTLLIEGESGSGKELVAREIHRRSPRAGGPFVPMNCAALPETLIESELFGHEKGAFSGAVGQRKGKFELADGGTLFLDEVGDMSLVTQAKVLRVLEEKAFERLGGSKLIHSDVRIVSATNKSLSEEVEAGRFREDLLFRLRVVRIPVPPLRERREDIPLLVDYFGRRMAEKMGFEDFSVDAATLERLRAYPWPGNVRELRNAMEQILVLAQKSQLTSDDLPPELFAGETRGERAGDFAALLQRGYEEARDWFDKQYLTVKLEQFGGNISKTAEAIGVHRQTLQYKLKQLGIKKKWVE
ncbi:MAG: sigma-54-dependent Fis family transcriptional regulator [Acidobacteria bacterium]|nr:sigma-54-dependent Fis family transcriptional regulator [Acidobacteriota bacterium]